MQTEKAVYLTTKEFARVVELTYGRIVQLIHAGEINAIKRGRDWLIPGEELIKFQARSKGASIKSPAIIAD